MIKLTSEQLLQILSTMDFKNPEYQGLKHLLQGATYQGEKVILEDKE
jgi:hypothetical protein